MVLHNIKLILQCVVYPNFIVAAILVTLPIVSVTGLSNSTSVVAKKQSGTAATSATIEPVITLWASRNISRSMISDTTTPTGHAKSNEDTTLLPQNANTIVTRQFLDNSSSSTDRTGVTSVTTRSESPLIDVKKSTALNFTTMRSLSVKFARIPVTNAPLRCHNAKNNTATSSPTTLSLNRATNRTLNVDVEKSTIDIVQQLLDSKTTIEPITFTHAMTTTPLKTKNSDEIEKVVVRSTVLVAENGTNEEIARVQLINDSSIENTTRASVLMSGDDAYHESGKVEPFRKAANSNQLENLETISVKVKLVNHSNESGTNKNEPNTTVDDLKFHTEMAQNTESFKNEKDEQLSSTSLSIVDDYTELGNIQLVKKNGSELSDSWEDIGAVATNVRIVEVKNENNSTSFKLEENDSEKFDTNSTLLQQENKPTLLNNLNSTQEFKNKTTILTNSSLTEKNNAEQQDLETTFAARLVTTTRQSQISDISTIFEMNVSSVSSTVNPISPSTKQANSQLNDSNSVADNTLPYTFNNIQIKSETIGKVFENYTNYPANQTDNNTSHKSQTSTIKLSTYSGAEDRLATFTASPSFYRTTTNEILNFSSKSREPDKFALFIRNDPLLNRLSASIQGEHIRESTTPIEPSFTSWPANVQEHKSESKTEIVESTSEIGTPTEKGIAIEAISTTSADFSTNVASTPHPGVANSTEFVRYPVDVSQIISKFENDDLSSTHDGLNTENCTSVSDFPTSAPEASSVKSSVVLSPTDTVISFPQLPFEESSFTEIYAQKFKMHPIKYINAVHSVNISPLNYRTVSSILSSVLPPATMSSGNTTSMPVSTSSIHNSDVPTLTSIFRGFGSNFTVKTDSSTESTTNMSSHIKSQDTKLVDSPWRNISLSNYKILLDSLMESKVKPATQISNVTKIPLIWLKSSPPNVTPSGIQLTASPFQTNTTMLQEENISFQSSQSLSNSSNAESSTANVTLKNEHTEERPEAKVYDSSIPYAEENRGEYQTIGNGPAVISARTTFTRAPEVTFTTITTTTLPTYQEVKNLRLEEASGETLLDRKLRERSFRKENSSNNNVSVSTTEENSKYFDVNVTEIEANVPGDRKISDRKRSHQQQTKNHNIEETPRKGESTHERNTLKFVPSLDEKDLKIVQNFVNKNLRILR